MVCHKPARSCVPDSRGSVADNACCLSAAVMNPPPGPADEIKMQVVEQQGQRRVVLLQHLSDEFAIHGLIAQQDLYRFGPRPVDFFFTHGFVTITQVQAHEAHQFLYVVLSIRLSQIWNRHAVLLLVAKTTRGTSHYRRACGGRFSTPSTDITRQK